MSDKDIETLTHEAALRDDKDSRIAELEDLLREAVNAGVAFEDPRIDYKEVQLDVRWFEDARAALQPPKGE